MAAAYNRPSSRLVSSKRPVAATPTAAEQPAKRQRADSGEQHQIQTDNAIHVTQQ